MYFNKTILVILLLTCIHQWTSCQEALPYPAVSEQRAAFANAKHVKPTRILDSLQIITDLRYLASDTCEGRRPGTEGHALAMQRILTRMRQAGLDSFGNSLIQTFEAKSYSGISEGKNVIGWLKGKKTPEKFIVISAHYDHMGRNKAGQTYYGADDNASGTACLLALAKYFKKHPQPYSIIFAAFDKEESGLQGSMKYVDTLDKQGKLASIKFNLNLDMVGRSDSNEVFACGIRHYPKYKNVVEQVQGKTNTRLLMGHDYGSMRDDWTKLSDQFAFHKKQIPFIFISVEDHADYHKPTDTVDRVNFSRYIENCNMIALLAQAIRVD